MTKRLNRLVSEQVHLVEQLDKSLALKSLWNEVFDHGGATSRWSGNPKDPDKMRKLKMCKLKREHTDDESLIITNGLGDTREFFYEKVPAILGGGYLINKCG